MSLTTFGSVLIASILACIVTTIGIYTISKHEKWGNQHVVYFMSFAAGVLISVSFLHIIPKSFDMQNNAPMFFLIGFFAFYLFNRFLTAFVCNDRDRAELTIGIIPMLGIGLHSLIDGVIYSVTFNVSVFTGALSAIGMVLHEFPEGIVTFLLLQRAGFSKTKSAFYAFLAAAISTPVGTLVSFPFISRIDHATLGILLAVSAGALVYVGASHLLPAVEKENRKYSLISLGAGILIAILIVLTKG